MSAIQPDSVPTQTFDWGHIKWFVTPRQTGDSNLTFGTVVLLPGKGHDRHDHPDSEEILFVLSGVGEQMTHDGEPFPVRAGDAIHIPKGVFHSTTNTGWEPLRLLAIYNPGGAEDALRDLPDFRELPPGDIPELEPPRSPDAR